MSREEAEKHLKELEADPKHTTRTPEAEKQTKDDDINDPKFHDLTGEVDSKWKQDKNGHWYLEGGE